MFTKKSYATLLLIGTVFSSHALSMENNSTNNVLLTQTSSYRTTNPEKSLGAEIISELPGYLGKEFKKEVSNLYTVGKKVYTEGWESIIGDSLEVFMNSVNSRYLSRFIKSNNVKEFDVESLRPLVEEMRHAMGYLIQNFCMKGNLSTLNQKTGKLDPFYLTTPEGKRITSYHLDRSVYQFLAEKLIPDFVPLKGLFITLTNFSPIKNYLEYKMDEMIIKGLLGLYQKTTGKTLKYSINDLVRSFTRGNSKQEVKDTQPELVIKKKSKKEKIKLEDPIIPSLESEDIVEIENKNVSLQPIIEIKKERSVPMESVENQVPEAYSHLWQYFEPQLAHFFRMAFTHVLTPISTTVLEETTDYALKSFLRSNTVIGGTCFLGGVSGVAIGGLLSTGLSYIPVVNLFAPLLQSQVINGSAGALVSAFVTAKTSQFASQKVKNRLENNLINLMDYYSYTLVPLSRNEHVRYNLNPQPTEEEKIIFAEDYKLKEKLEQQTLIGELIHDVLNTGSTVLNYLAEPLKSLEDYVVKFYRYCLGSNDISTQEILARLESEEGSSQPLTTKETTKKQSNIAAEIILGQLMEKLAQKKELSKKEQELLDNLSHYPSYGIKSEAIKLIQFWRNDSDKLTEELKSIEKKKQESKQRLIDTYHLYSEEIPTQFAMVYQFLGNDDWSGKFGIDFIVVEELVAKNLKAHVNDLTENELVLFQKAVKDEEFLYDYLKEFVSKHPNSAKKMLSYNEAKDILKDPLLIKNLPSTYAEAKNKEYIQTYQAGLKAIEKSILGYGLSRADIIDLHQRMTEEQLERYAQPKVIDYKEAIEPELKLIEDKVKQLVKENEPAIVKHYSDCFIKQVDFKELLKEAFSNMPKTIEEESKSINLEDVNYKKAIEKYIHSEEEIKLALAKANWIAQNYITGTKEFSQFRKELSKFVGYKDVKTLVYTVIQNAIFDYLLTSEDLFKEWELVENVTIKQPEVNQSFVSKFFGTKTSPSHEIVKLEDAHTIEPKKVQQVIIKPYLDLRPTSQEDVGGFLLSEIIIKLQSSIEHLQDITAIKKKDLKMIHDEIQKHKRQTLDFDALAIAKDHLAELIAFKNGLEKYQNRLFYGYSEIVDAILEQNQKIIHEIKSQEKRES